jgi:hypothetical protein
MASKELKQKNRNSLKYTDNNCKVVFKKVAQPFFLD